ncbi:hypothetical protein [Streptomyces sp. NPDC058045]|uniref:hypothetical protein n=1 Tax=Streptomyces sp. NPDC058045 TaxID=3346311 RepID=UPI0036EB3AC4
MGIRLIVDMLDHAPQALTHREAYVLVALAEDANDETRTTWNSVERPQMLRRARVSRSQMYAVLKSLVAKGALEKVSAGQKNGTAKYRIPEPQCPEIPDTDTPSQCPENRDTDAPQSPGTPDTDAEAQCPETPDTEAAQCPGIRDVSVPESGTPTPHNPSPTTPSASKQETPAADRFGPDIPEAARPLVDALTAAGVTVRWPFRGDAWFPVLAVIKTAGIPAMVDHAVAARSRTRVESAKYFLRGWAELPPIPAPGTQRPPLRAVAGGGHQPFQCPPASAYENDLGF